MEIQRLKSDIIARIRSSSTINNVTQCVTELVLNSLDSKSTSIAVRVNLVTFKIQVVDNGEGITKKNLELTGLRYMTNKCNNLIHLEKHINYHGFRGEALASIIDISKIVNITSKHVNSLETYSKSFGKFNDKHVTSVKNRPSYGTTVTVEEFEDIKRTIESLIIMYPNVSFSVRNDLSGNLIVNSQKNKDIISAFKYLHPEIDEEFSLMKVSKNKVAVEALLFKEVTVIKGNNPKKNLFKRKLKKLCSGSIEKESNLASKDKVAVNDRLNKERVKTDLIKDHTDNKNSLASQKLLKQYKKHEKDCKKQVTNKEPIENDQNDFFFSDISVNDMVHDKKINKLSNNKINNNQNIHESVDDNDIYSISDSTPVKKFNDKKFKKPLPIQIMQSRRVPNLPNSTQKIVNYYTSMSVSPYTDQNKNCNATKEIVAITNTCFESSLKKIVPQKLENEKSSLSTFTADENKGKNLIMDMFLKSTQVYNSEEDNKTNTRSEEIILEVESNFLLENNIQTNINGFSKTMSMSVNIRSTKKFKKQKVNKNTEVNRTTKCIQTTLDEKNMVSKYIQTTIDHNVLNNNRFKCSNLSDILEGKKQAENYTIVLSDSIHLNRAPHFKFVYQNPTRFNLKPINKFTSTNNCNCNCHLNASKIFKFVDSAYKRSCKQVANDVLNNVDLFDSNCELNDDIGSTERFHHGKSENCGTNIKSAPRDAMKFNQLTREYDQHKQHENVPYSNYDPFTNGILMKETQHVLKKPYHEKGFVQRKTILNRNIFGFDRSPYFLPRQNRKPTKPILENLDRNHENRYREVDTESYPVKERLFLNMPNNVDSYKLFNPQCQSTQLIDFNKNNYLNMKNHVGRVPENFFQTGNNFVEGDFTIDHFGNFQPVYKSTQCGLMNFAMQGGFHQQNDIVCTSFEEYNKHNFISNNFDNFQPIYKSTRNCFKENLDFQEETVISTPFCGFSDINNYNTYIDCASETDKGNIPSEAIDQSFLRQERAHQAAEAIQHSNERSELIATLSNQQKQELLKREWNAERNLNKKEYLEWDSQLAAQEDTKQNEWQEFGKEWVKRKNNFGSSFYMNKRTGFATFFTPKPHTNHFKFGRRFEFMPKGMSPILKDVKQVDRSLNQNEKEKLQNYILESHQNELLIVKWQNYIKHNDPKTFFDEVYKEKLKLFEDSIPNINAPGNKKYMLESDNIHFNKTLFDNINVIGQVDGKFIAVFEKTKNLLILFDQHAVHERIRLEGLLKGYTNAKIKCVDKLFFLISRNDLSLLKKHELYLSSLGLLVEFFSNGINILEIPLCIYNKFKDSDYQNSVNEIIQLLINEIIELLKDTRGASFENLPKIIQNVINLEACRGAIKFGDNLRKKDCMELLGKLAICKLPFQCAHGRPTLTPLIKLNLAKKYVGTTQTKP
ncbi:hypothetical protein NQ314_002913 [Rhamnusium bicolor]|uniref:MutL C-terminal dimerisation domain-containing protein n=1 Tax=Rhamnusium bicolor TaxID=1586634 RepID=A0AAV8ZR01_9CUCU|nr:hypothetical protein NQ314_002913 [Rhamnusium bicolor]